MMMTLLNVLLFLLYLLISCCSQTHPTTLIPLGFKQGQDCPHIKVDKPPSSNITGSNPPLPTGFADNTRAFDLKPVTKVNLTVLSTKTVNYTVNNVMINHSQIIHFVDKHSFVINVTYNLSEVIPAKSPLFQSTPQNSTLTTQTTVRCPQSICFEYAQMLLDQARYHLIPVLFPHYDYHLNDNDDTLLHSGQKTTDDPMKTALDDYVQDPSMDIYHINTRFNDDSKKIIDMIAKKHRIRLLKAISTLPIPVHYIEFAIDTHPLFIGHLKFYEAPPVNMTILPLISQMRWPILPQIESLMDYYQDMHTYCVR